MTARYVVLHHSGIPEPHFDVMFDTGDAGLLVTWRSPVWPIAQPTMLTRLVDHRREYLTFEGEISGDRGRVDRVAEGTCDVEFAAQRWVVRMDDARLVLDRKSPEQWLASFGGGA
jgi:hypothetical protein